MIFFISATALILSFVKSSIIDLSAEITTVMTSLSSATSNVFPSDVIAEELIISTGMPEYTLEITGLSIFTTIIQRRIALITERILRPILFVRRFFISSPSFPEKNLLFFINLILKQLKL